ncbi:RNA polymerase II-associated protein 3 [Auxenochlorella protothecoides]|uniref:RNA polymerase II-associated protein 3 n=1 Tax=Auxenochlorella protothecoides TaxID=3075 RepID=A0A087SFE1_AUXPR|nr:RNA polymerase II-associated protein 3 [Auxenochlorella protothecoides]KFM24445.1 RNA polymerase II-associated protein 3 [Auxenochlorella protothecoides]
MEAQRRAMQQAQELQAYMKDLLKWEKDVEVKPRGLREEGNEHFRKGRLNEAAASYTTSLKLKPTPAAFANRAAVYLKRREWDRAEADCSACLELDAGFVKAYHRRATAREALGDMHGAAADFERVFCHDPSSTQAVESRARCLRAFLDSQPLNGAPSPGSQGPSGPLQVSVSLEACEPGPSPGVSLLLEQEAGGSAAALGVEFERAWRGSKRDPPAQAALLCAIPPARLPHLLTHVLNPELLAEVAMRVLESVARRQPSLALDLLRALRCVPRFPMLAMGLAPRQCAALRNAWDGCGGLPGAEPELLKAFGLQ